ncbi:MAG: hypothetical protein OWS74_00250 [Firmicutes bacterium]|nr:hypothetical protein [Bacillota bacterium]
MRLWGEWHIGSLNRSLDAFLLRRALTFHRERVWTTTFGMSPVWAYGWRYIWKLRRHIDWQRLVIDGQLWWIGQHQSYVVVAGYGKRPAVMLTQGAWQGMIPPGEGAAVALLPQPDVCTWTVWVHEEAASVGRTLPRVRPIK